MGQTKILGVAMISTIVVLQAALVFTFDVENSWNLTQGNSSFGDNTTDTGGNEDGGGKSTWWVILSEGGKALGCAILAAIVIPTAINCFLCCCGCRVGGVGRGTRAALIQSEIGDVEEGSYFARAQSLGATGGVRICGPVGKAAGVVAAGSYIVYSMVTHGALGYILLQYKLVVAWIDNRFN